MKKRKD